MTPEKEREFMASLAAQPNGESLKRLYAYVKVYHLGKGGAITLPELWQDLSRQHLDVGLGVHCHEDLRRLLADNFPFCSGSQGVYYPATAEEVREFHEWLRSRSISLFARLKKVEEFHRDLLDASQLKLPL